MPLEGTRRTKIDQTAKPENIATEPKMAAENIDVEGLQDRELLLRILANQKSADVKLEERFKKLTKQANSSKKLFDQYKEENDKEVATVKSDISNTLAELKALQDKVKSLES